MSGSALLLLFAGGTATPPVVTDSLLGAIYRAYTGDATLVSLLPRFTVGETHAGGALPWGIVTKTKTAPAHASGGTRIEATTVQFVVYAAGVAALETITDRIKVVFTTTVSLPIAGGTVLGFYLSDDRLVAERRQATAANPYTFCGHLAFKVFVSRPN